MPTAIAPKGLEQARMMVDPVPREMVDLFERSHPPYVDGPGAYDSYWKSIPGGESRGRLTFGRSSIEVIDYPNFRLVLLQGNGTIIGRAMRVQKNLHQLDLDHASQPAATIVALDVVVETLVIKTDNLVNFLTHLAKAVAASGGQVGLLTDDELALEVQFEEANCVHVGTTPDALFAAMGVEGPCLG